MKALIPIALTLILAACGSSGSTGSTDLSGPNDTSVQSDTAVAQDTAPPAPSCSDENPCEAGFLCDCNGTCQTDPVSNECTEDKNCGGGNYCDTCINRCFPKKDMCAPCTSDNQCNGTKSRCLDFSDGKQYCGRGCISVVGCKDDSHATSTGFDCQSIPGINDKQCLPLSGSCEAPELCASNADCPLGEYCNTDLGQCADGCANDTECPVGTVCSALQCQAPCSESNPCPTDFNCEEDGHCKPEGGCLEPGDCLLPETYCDMATQTCQPGCLEDFDCKSAKKICVNESCEEKPCDGNFWCAFGQVCDIAAGGCKEAEGPFCDVCEDDAACGPGGKCIELQDDDGNSKGKFCAPACGTDPLNLCPNGYNCLELEDENGAPTGESICFRDCSYNPIGE